VLGFVVCPLIFFDNYSEIGLLLELANVGDLGFSLKLDKGFRNLPQLEPTFA
jgi:hypothetical protein